MGIGARSATRLYSVLDKDTDSQPLDCSKANYILRFAKGEFPPLSARLSFEGGSRRTSLNAFAPLGEANAFIL